MDIRSDFDLPLRIGIDPASNKDGNTVLFQNPPKDGKANRFVTLGVIQERDGNPIILSDLHHSPLVASGLHPGLSPRICRLDAVEALATSREHPRRKAVD
jgi:hypothetical protein